MVECLSLLDWPEHLYIIFQSSVPCPDQETRCPPPLTNTVLPVLTSFTLKSVTRDLNHLFAHMATPLLQHSEFRHSHPAIFEVWQVGPGHVACATSCLHRRSPKFCVQDVIRKFVTPSELAAHPVVVFVGQRKNASEPRSRRLRCLSRFRRSWVSLNHCTYPISYHHFTHNLPYPVPFVANSRDPCFCTFATMAHDRFFV